MLILLALLLSGTQVGAGKPVSAVQVTACQLATHPAEFDGKLVSVRDRVIAGPHDEYILAKGCSREDARAKYILVEYDPKSPPLRALSKAMVRQSKDVRITVTATLRGKVTASLYPRFGFVSAQVMLQVVEAAHIRIGRAE